MNFRRGLLRALPAIAAFVLGALLTLLFSSFLPRNLSPAWKEILKPAVGTVTGALIALFAVWLHRYYDVQKQREDRRQALLSQVYLDAWEDLQATFTGAMVIGVSSDAKEIRERIESLGKIKNYLARVYTVGSLESIRAFEALNSVAQKFSIAMAGFYIRRLFRQMSREQMEKELAELESQGKQADATPEEREENQKKQRSLRAKTAELLVHETKDMKDLVEAFVTAQTTNAEKLAPAIREVRRDLGLPSGDEQALSELIRDSARQTEIAWKPILTFFEGMQKLVDMMADFSRAKKKDDSSTDRSSPERQEDQKQGEPGPAEKT